MTEKLVSVIIPFYKEIDLLPRAVQSAASQQLPPGWTLEVVIGNDGSYGVDEITSACAMTDVEIKVARNLRENGAGNARNAAIDAATGSVLAFLDADDYWLHGKLLAQLKLLQAGANFSASAYRFRGTDAVVHPPATLSTVYQFFRKLSVGASTVVVTRNLIEDERFSNLRFSQDTEFWARLFASGRVVFQPLDGVFTVYEPSGRTANKLVQFVRFREIVRSFSLRWDRKAAIYVTYAVRGVTNHVIKAFIGRFSKRLGFSSGVSDATF